MKKTKPDYYGVMGVKRDASLSAIKQAYRELVRRYHPDTAGDSPEARERFELLQAAYEMLSDSSRRAQYDKTLPAQKYPLTALDAPTLWREVTDLILERSDAFGPMLQAMRAAVGLALEQDVLIVGVAGKNQYLAGHLETSANRHRITEALREVAGGDISYRVIEGDAIEDWEWIKRAEGRKPGAGSAPSPPPAPARAQGESAVKEPEPRPAQVTEWELLGRKIQNTWQGTPGRQHPVTRAEFMLTCVNWIADTAKEAAAEGAARDSIQREVGKALERVAHLLELPSAVVALELVRGSPRRRHA